MPNRKASMGWGVTPPRPLDHREVAVARGAYESPGPALASHDNLPEVSYAGEWA